MADLANPHDKFFRATMQNTLVAQEFFERYLPTPVRKGLNFDTLKLCCLLSTNHIAPFKVTIIGFDQMTGFRLTI